MEDPVNALIGASLIGLGSVICYGAYKNKKVFGKDGILPTALTKGTLADTSQIPSLFPGPTVSSLPATQVEPDTTLPQIGSVKEAVQKIGRTHPELAARIGAELVKVKPNSTRGDLEPLRQLLEIATSLGYDEETKVIIHFVDGVALSGRG